MKPVLSLERFIMRLFPDHVSFFNRKCWNNMVICNQKNNANEVQMHYSQKRHMIMVGCFFFLYRLGMYNPVYIAMERSIDVANYGVLILTGLTALTLFIIRFYTKNFSWLKQDVKEFYDVVEED